MECKNCANQTICKFIDNTESIRSQVRELQILTNSPMRVEIKCARWQNGNQNSSTLINQLGGYVGGGTARAVYATNETTCREQL